ncbi:MAG: hypothetical protein SVM80_11615 [Halobacteriota archaeon]|nr:hypothetical protein [Halobacteriota archaeon]
MKSELGLVERREDRLRYLKFSIIGIVSYLSGFYLGDEMGLGYSIFKITGGPLAVAPFAFAIFAVLFSLELYRSKKYTLGFALKAFGISLLFLALTFFGIMTYGAYMHIHSTGINVDVVIPENFINLTEADLEEYASLKEAIMHAEKNGTGFASIHPDEWKQIISSHNPKRLQTIEMGDDYFNISGEYYRTEFFCRLATQRVSEIPKEGIYATEEELTEYPILKTGKRLTDKRTEEEQPYKMVIGFDRWFQLEEFFDYEKVRAIEFNGKYYEFTLISELRVHKCYLELTEEELADFPDLKEVIELASKSEDGHATLEVHPDEWNQINNFLEERGSYTIKVGDGYYEVRFSCA